MIHFSKKCCIDGKIKATVTSILDNVGHDETKTNKTVTAITGDRTRVVRIRYVIKTTLALTAPPRIYLPNGLVKFVSMC